MELEKTIKGNILIALFMGMTRIDEYRLRYGQEWYETIDRGRLTYHSSWDDLMPVIEQIFNMEWDECDVYKAIHIEYLMEDIESNLIDINIEKTHLSVVEFLEWYNGNILTTQNNNNGKD